jgi:ribosomal protein L37AE/L43A
MMAEGQEQVPNCPVCRSLSVTPIIYSVGSWESVSVSARTSPAAAAQIPPHDTTSPNWECRRCGHRWPDPGRVRTSREVRAHYTALRASWCENDSSIGA